MVRWQSGIDRCRVEVYNRVCGTNNSHSGDKYFREWYSGATPDGPTLGPDNAPWCKYTCKECVSNILSYLDVRVERVKGRVEFIKEESDAFEICETGVL